MDLSSGVSVGTLLLTLAGVFVSGGIAWGSLLQRVRTLEREMASLAGFTERMARMEEKMDAVKDEIGKLTSSWLFREPPGYTSMNRPGSKR